MKKSARFDLYSVFLSLVGMLGLFSIVVPNSFQFVTVTLLALSFVASLLISRGRYENSTVFFLYFLGCFVTAVYLLVGVVNGAPKEALFQVFFIYIVSPLMWLVVIVHVVSSVREEVLVKAFSFYAILSILSVALFFYLYNVYGPSSVSLFKENANVHLSNGYAAATMHVYGSLIFITGAFFSALDLRQSKFLKAFLLLGLLVVAFTSGRSALLLSVPLGLAFGFLCQIGSVKRIFLNIIALSLVLLVSLFSGFMLAYLFEIDIFQILDRFFNKLLQGGGEARFTQAKALLDGIDNNYGLGSGHGVGVEYLRSERFPWRYEAIWLATVYRTGFIGAIIYALPYVFLAWMVLVSVLMKRIDVYDRFFGGGMLAVFFASTTNPYIEAFSFQWMYAFPIVYYFRKFNLLKGFSYRGSHESSCFG